MENIFCVFLCLRKSYKPSSYIYIYIYIYIPNMYLESYMSRVLDIPKYRANKDKDKINLVYFIRFIHYSE